MKIKLHIGYSGRSYDYSKPLPNEEYEDITPEEELRTVEIPDNSHYVVIDYDGVETLYYSDSPIKMG